jgi:hypothetical protein
VFGVSVACSCRLVQVVSLACVQEGAFTVKIIRELEGGGRVRVMKLLILVVEFLG